MSKINIRNVSGDNNVFGDNNNVYNQITYSLPDTTDYKLLSSEIKTLKQALIGKATLPEHYEALAELTVAEAAANNKNGNKVVKSLLAAGKWALDTAREIGINVVAEIINKQIGSN